MSSYWVIRFLFIRFDLFTLDIQHRIVLCLSFQKYFFLFFKNEMHFMILKLNYLIKESGKMLLV